MGFQQTEFANWRSLHFSPGALGITMNQYDSLMLKLDRLEEALSKLHEKEVSKAEFAIATNLRLSAIESQLAKDAYDLEKRSIKDSEDHKDSAAKSEQFRHCIQQQLDDLKVQVGEIKVQSQALPIALENRWKGAATVTSILIFLIGGIYSVLSACVWVYDRFIKLAH